MNGYLLWQAANLWQRKMRTVLAPHGLTPVQFLLLAGLDELGRAGATSVTQALLAGHCQTDPMMTSQVLRMLEKVGLIRRAAHEGDRRAIAVTITTDGTELVSRLAGDVHTVDTQFHAPLSEFSETFGDALQLLTGKKPRRRVRAKTG